MKKNIDVRIPKGFRDLPPDVMIIRENLLEKLKRTFWKYGFEPLETPTLEYFDILKGKMGDEAEKLMYNFKDRGNRELGLIYDLTVPLSRYVSMHSDLVMPFKRYQFQRVWRADKPQKGRYREFYQCDIDIIGESSMLADAEIISLLNEGFEAVGFDKFVIKINNRKLLAAIVEYAGLDSDAMFDVCRAVDKADKIGKDGVEQELLKNGFGQSEIDRIFELLDHAGDIMQKMSELRHTLKHIPIALEGLDELEQVFTYLEKMEIPKERYDFDLYLSRGLDYYTGTIFETELTQIPNFGSISGGGRYDNLIGIFSKRSLPAVGTSFGFDRILAAMKELNMISSGSTRTEVLIVLFDKSLINNGLALATKLRKADINTEMYYKPGKLRRQLGYANDKNIPIALILGPDEVKQNEVSLKNLITAQQQQVPLSEIIDFIKNTLKQD